jgi:hypothetical protein
MIRTATIFIALFLVSGCAMGTQVDVVTILTHDNCGRAVSGVELVDFAAVAALRPSTRLIGMKGAPEHAEEGVLLVAIGQGTRPTPGYGLAVAKPGVLDAGTLTLSIAEKQPPADAVLAQMITQPCLVVGVPETGVSRVKAVTADGTVIGEVSIKAQ